MKNQKGFSLVELLVVVIIIAIIAAIAIPNLLASRRAGNEASAVSSLRTIHSANVTYQATFGGGAAFAVIGTLDDAGVELIDATLAAGTKSGYTFASSLAADPFNAYCANAEPTVDTGATRTGDRRFGVSTDGVIYQHPTALPPCAAGILDTTGTTPIQ